MTLCAGIRFALLVTLAACADRCPEGDAIVATLNSPANLDLRVGSDEASQKAPQLILNNPPMSWAFEGRVFDFTYEPAEAVRLVDRGGFPDPDGNGPLACFRFTLKTSTAEAFRVQAAAIQHDQARLGIAVDVRSGELQTLLADALHGNLQMCTLQ